MPLFFTINYGLKNRILILKGVFRRFCPIFGGEEMFTGNIILSGIDLYDEYGITAVNVNQGMMESHFGIVQSVIEDKTSDLDIPHFFGVDKQPFTFTMTFAKEKKWDYKTKLDFARLLFTPYYQELESVNQPEVVYKVICVDQPKKVLNGIDRGYITISFRTDAPWGWSPKTIITKVVSGASDSNPYTFQLENMSNVLQWYYPEVEFKTVGTEFKMGNNKDSDRDFIFADVYDGEVIYVDNKMKKVISDQPYPLNYRLEKFNKNWFRLKYGKNTISVYRDCTITFRMQYPIAI